MKYNLKKMKFIGIFCHWPVDFRRRLHEFIWSKHQCVAYQSIALEQVYNFAFECHVIELSSQPLEAQIERYLKLSPSLMGQLSTSITRVHFKWTSMCCIPVDSYQTALQLCFWVSRDKTKQSAARGADRTILKLSRLNRFIIISWNRIRQTIETNLKTKISPALIH